MQPLHNRVSNRRIHVPSRSTSSLCQERVNMFILVIKGTTGETLGNMLFYSSRPTIRLLSSRSEDHILIWVIHMTVLSSLLCRRSPETSLRLVLHAFVPLLARCRQFFLSVHN